MAKVLARVEGLDGQIELLPDRIVISREGLWNAIKYGFNSRREIPLGAISEVMFRGGSALRFGEIEFVRSGRSTDEKKSSKQSTVRFGKVKNQEFEVFKEKVFVLMEKVSRQHS